MTRITKNAKIVLANGTVFEGFFFGFSNSVYGEFIFNTSITGYEELITDPSYNQQIVVMSFPVQGIYGASEKFFQSKKIQVAGFVVDTIEDDYDHYESNTSLSEILNKYQVTGICGIDTRYLVQIIREHGSIKGAIVPITENTKEVLKKIKAFKLNKHVEKVQPNELDNQLIHDKNKLKLIVYNFGCKQNIITDLKNNGFEVTIVPWNTKFADLEKYEYDAIFLSNGPGDPLELVSVISEIKKMIAAKKIILGICLGNQLASLALGMKIYKLNYGHHSINHPVKDLFTNKVFITSQNHNYAVEKTSLVPDVSIWLESINDNSIEGIYSNKYKTMAVQFHPEACPGPIDSKYIFNSFYNFVKEKKYEK